jgi:diguanylate cyclase (GGDEF)-like protein
VEAASFAADETGRLIALEATRLVGTPPERRFDRIVHLAMRLTTAPIGAFSLIEEIRVFFKSRLGEDAAGVSLGAPHRDFWFCSHVVGVGHPLVIADARADVRLSRLAVVTSEPGLRAYCGAPVREPGGHHVGVLGVFDVKPREFTAAEQRALVALAHLLEAELSALPHATTDALTGVVNARAFARIGDRLLEFSDARGEPSVVVRFDVAGIGAINQTFGFEEGDRALVDAARIIGETVRGSDLVGRIGPDEFGVVLVGADADAARLVLRRFEAAVKVYNASAGRPFTLAFHIAHAGHRTGGGADLSALLTVAAMSAELG